MGLGCLVEAGLFGDNILYRRSPDLQTFSLFFVVYRNHLQFPPLPFCKRLL